MGWDGSGWVGMGWVGSGRVSNTYYVCLAVQTVDQTNPVREECSDIVLSLSGDHD